MGERLAEIRNLTVEFGAGPGAVRAVENVSLDLRAGETLCLVGESGSGKTVTALSLARLLPSPPARYVGGEVRVLGMDVLRLGVRELRKVRGGVVAYVFQEPGASLNPVFRVGTQIAEAVRQHRPEAAGPGEVVRLLKLVGIPAPERRARDFPHQLSGGMQQRAMLAMALASAPRLLVADEPTTALDVTIQAQVLELLRDLQARLGMSLLLITHNLGIVGEMAGRVAVMYAGQVVEEGPAKDVLARPHHPYTRGLLESVPRLGQQARRLSAIPGSVPRPGAYPGGCRYHPRCPRAQRACAAAPPAWEEPQPGRRVRCPLHDRDPGDAG
jgi:oligopeptide/dipeptide ABC transporter ATP-binding protein